ncbi:hypothetical protein AAFF_G00063990 [Aldrovandia affinis]|uniref:Uncharacterized protein n=1 Tax=Aldrovandia affinis TaxID=143900 RepID=A0AAD7WXZ9_9TELE|nr:hypothetical protein AAFF_G00063990 [Aldrovandia affinis]
MTRSEFWRTQATGGAAPGVHIAGLCSKTGRVCSQDPGRAVWRCARPGSAGFSKEPGAAGGPTRPPGRPQDGSLVSGLRAAQEGGEEGGREQMGRLLVVGEKRAGISLAA